MEASPLLELEILLREAQEEQADIQRLYDRVGRLMTEAAFEEFPWLKQMSAAQIRDFGDAVSRSATNFAMRAANIAHAVETENTRS